MSFLALCYLLPSASVGQSDKSNEIVKTVAGIRNSHNRLFHVPGGIGIHYRLDVEQDSRNPVFVWRNGLDGSLNIKWPEMRCRVEGQMSGYQVQKDGKNFEETRPTIREANYNFETQAGVGRDGTLLGQIVNYRHAFSAIMGFPLVMQCYVEMDQYYVPGEALKTAYWLPNAVEQHSYKLRHAEATNGIPCQVLERSGLDTLWVATGHGYVICKREYHFGVGKPLRERVQNLDLKEVAPAVWIPLRQIKEEFDSEVPGKLKVRYTLKVLETKVGKVSDNDIRIVLDENMAKIEDYINGKLYEPAANNGKPFELRVQSALESNLKPPSNTLFRTSFLLIVCLVLGIMMGRLL